MEENVGPAFVDLLRVSKLRRVPSSVESAAVAIFKCSVSAAVAIFKCSVSAAVAIFKCSVSAAVAIFKCSVSFEREPLPPFTFSPGPCKVWNWFWGKTSDSERTADAQTLGSHEQVVEKTGGLRERRKEQASKR